MNEQTGLMFPRQEHDEQYFRHISLEDNIMNYSADD